jgi:hypothetical protein
LVPAVVVDSVSPLVRETFPLAHALRISVLWTGCGIVVFAGAFLLSIVVPGEYSAPAVCIAALFFYLALVHVQPLARFPSANVFSVMNMVGPIPWLRLAIMGMVAMGFIAIGSFVTRRQDF